MLGKSLIRYFLIGLIVFLVIGCKSKVEDTDEILETLTLSEDCTGQDSCCEDACIKFCKEQGKVYAKHFVNGIHCPCWCE